MNVRDQVNPFQIPRDVVRTVAIDVIHFAPSVFRFPEERRRDETVNALACEHGTANEGDALIPLHIQFKTPDAAIARATDASHVANFVFRPAVHRAPLFG